MRVLFANPPWWEGRRGTYLYAGVRAGSRWPFTQPVRSQPDRFRFGDYLPVPFFLAYAASYVRRATGAHVVLRDSIARRESEATFFAHLRQVPYDFVFLESATPSFETDRRVIREIHRIRPGTRIVVTGPVTSTRAEEILAAEPVYACIRGEYEKGAVRVLGGASGVLDHDLLTEDEMNGAPFPDFDPGCATHYWDANPRGQLAPQAQVFSSRGCPYKCIFCVWPATMTGNDPDGSGRRTVRHYSAEYMEAFLREIVERYGFRCIYFDDDTFNLGDRHVLAMCEVMERIGLPWSAMCRADTIRLETWARMREAGCFGVKLGFESGNQWVVDHIVKKRLDLELAREVVHELKRLGMTVHGTFTYGLPGETREQMEDTRRYIASLPLDSYQESGTAEIEGTPLHRLRTEGHLPRYDGARLSEDYEPLADGKEKLRRMVGMPGRAG